MKKLTRCLILLFVALVITGVASARDRVVVKPNAAKKFATLPDDLRFPEGITANPDTGEIYVATFDGGVANSLLRFTKNGRLVARTDFAGITPLLGLAFNPRDNKVYICSVDDFTVGGSRIKRIDADFADSAAAEDVAFIPGVGAPPDRMVENPDTSQDVIQFGNVARVPNALTFNSAGDLFVSDSFQGAIFRINSADTCTTPCSVEVVAHDGLLATAGFPPFGANGLALNGDESTLYIANTGDDRILGLNLGSGNISVFAESINGADGIAFDNAGYLWVAGNQADQVVALNGEGRVVAELGEFLGIRKDGKARGLIFPASLVIVKNKIFVTNLALPLTPAAGDEPEEDVSTYTVSRIKIPKL